MGARAPMWTSVIEALDEAQGLQMPKLTVKQRQEKTVQEVRSEWITVLAT